jgi:hypothetical protein
MRRHGHPTRRSVTGRIDKIRIRILQLIIALTLISDYLSDFKLDFYRCAFGKINDGLIFTPLPYDKIIIDKSSGAPLTRGLVYLSGRLNFFFGIADSSLPG